MRGSRESTDRVSVTQSRGFSFPSHHEGNAGASEAYAGSLQAAPAASPCTHLPAAPGSNWEYGSGLVPEGVLVPPCKKRKLIPWKTPSLHGRGVKGAWWSGQRGVTPHQCLASAGRGIVHTSNFGSGTPGAEDTPSRLLNPCEFPIAGGTCSMPKDT